MDGRDAKNVSEHRVPPTSGVPASARTGADGGSDASHHFSYAAAAALTNADICQMCLLLGIQVMCPNEATKRKHTDDHRRAAAAFLSLEDWALPPTEAQVGKCFPQYAPDFFQHQPAADAVPRSTENASRHYGHDTRPPQIQQVQQRPPQRSDGEQIQRTVAAILFSANPGSSSPPEPRQPPPRLSTAESREASISEAVAAVAANSSASRSSGFAAATSSVSMSKKSRSCSGGGPQKRPKTTTAFKNGRAQTTAGSDAKEQFTKSVIAAIEASVASGEFETNFRLVRDKPSCKWPRFIIDGYAYRVGRVYSTGKCELRCVLKQGCNGKAVVEKNGSGYIARIVPGSMHFHSPPTFSEPESEKPLV